MTSFSTSQTIGICIVGCGHIARLHAWAARSLRPKVHLYFASRSKEKAEAYRRRFGAEGSFGSYEAAARDERVNALVICTPHDLHPEGVELAAVHGKDILLEKPIARSLPEADAMIRRADEAGVLLMVAENFRFKPSVLKAKQLIEQGAVGALKFVCVKTLYLATHAGWRSDENRMGGGALIDGGIHWVNTLTTLGGKARSAFALEAPRTRPNVPREDSMIMLADLGDGVAGELVHSWGVPSPGRFQFSVVSGTEGSLYIENHGFFLFLSGKRRRVYPCPLRDRRGFRAMYQEFAQSLRERRSPLMSGEAARQDLAFVLAAYESAKTGGKVSLAEKS